MTSQSALINRLILVHRNHLSPGIAQEAEDRRRFIVSTTAETEAMHNAELDAIRFLTLAEAPIVPRQPKRDEYRGNPLLVLPFGDTRDFSFGVGKAKAIIEYIDIIRAFVDEHESPKPRYATQDAAMVAAGLGEDKY